MGEKEDKMKRMLRLSKAITNLAEEFEDCPGMQAMLHSSFALYAAGEVGKAALTSLAIVVHNVESSIP